MRQHLLAIIAVLAAAILALFSINTEYSSSRYGYGYGRQNVVGTQFIASNGTDTPNTKEFVMPVVRANNHSPLQGKTVPIVQDEHSSLVGAKNFSLLHHTAMTALSPTEIPPLDAGMVNVTANVEFKMQNAELENGGETDNNVRATGYRVQSPVNNSEFRIAIPYDPSLLPQGFTEDDIQTYVYDRQYHRWMAIERDSVNEVELLVYSRFSRNPLVRSNNMYPSDVETFHETSLQTPTMNITDFMQQMGEGGGDSPLDFINAVLKTPEMPETSAYTPTSIKELKAADPLEGLTLMQPPTANNSGTANLSYPIEIPAGRQGMQPNLALTYSSSGGNGWLGVGWDIPIPSITVETRWGVPRYDQEMESEVYVYEGEQLVTFDSVANKFREMPHRTNHWTSRSVLDLDSVEQFYPRKNEVFDSIVRHGNGPSSYWWTVTHKNGVTDYYGKYASDNNVNNSCVLRAGADNTHGPIAHWALAESVDPFGNSVRYHYQVEFHIGTNNSPNAGRQIYIDTILYTVKENDPGKYKVVFTRQQGREDITIAANRGFKEVTASTLCNIAIGYDNKFFKYYVFETEYGRNTNYKTLLKNVTVLHTTTDTVLSCVILKNISTDSSICTHFDYFNYPETTDLFGDPVSVVLTNDTIKSTFVTDGGNLAKATALGGTRGKSWNIGGTATVGVGPVVPLTTFSVGGNFNYSRSKSEGALTLIDLDGDGLADKVYKKRGKLYYRKHIADSEYHFHYDLREHELMDCSDIQNSRNLTDFLSEMSSTTTWGLQLSIGLAYSGSWPTTKSTTSVYFADVNADGLPDLITDGGVLFNVTERNGIVKFRNYYTLAAENAGTENDSTFVHTTTDTCGGIIFSGEVSDSIVCQTEWISDTVFSFSYPISQENEALYAHQFHYADSLDRTSDHRCVYIYCDKDKPLGTICSINIYKKVIVSCDPFPTSTSASEIMERDPDFETVKVWVAPHDGKLTLTSDIRLIQDHTVSRQQSKMCDGVSYAIQHCRNVDVDTNHILLPSIPCILDTGSIGGSIYSSDTSVIVVDSVKKNDLIFFRLISGNNHDFDNVVWRQTIQYIGDTEVYDSKRDYVVSGNKSFGAGMPDPFGRNRMDLSFTINTETIYPSNSSKKAILKVDITDTIGHICSTCTKKCTLQNNMIDSVWPALTNYQIPENNHIKIYVTCDDSNFPWHLVKITPHLFYFVKNVGRTDTIEYYPQVDLQILKKKVTTLDSVFHKLFGPLYKGWGQFAYHNNDTLPDGTVTHDDYIHLEKLIANWENYPSNQNQANSKKNKLKNFHLKSEDSTHVRESSEMLEEMSIDTLYNPISLKTSWVEMQPDFQHQAWVGYGNINFVTDSTMCNTRMPGYYTDTNTEDIVEYDHPVPVVTQGQVKTVRKQNYSKMKNHSLSLTAPLVPFSVGTSVSEGYNLILTDYMDMNGDRYPDVLGQSQIQYSQPWGGIGDVTPMKILKSSITQSDTKANGKNFGGSFEKPSRGASNNPKNSKISFDGAGSVGASHGGGEDETSMTLMDMNGDGLPDKVIKNETSLEVYMNMGYSFLEKDSYNDSIIRKGKSENEGLSFGGNFNIGQASIGGGIGVNFSKNLTGKTLMDFNADGIPDMVERDTSTGHVIMKVNYAKGNGEWSGWETIPQLTDISFGRSFSESADASVTAGFTFFGIIKLCVGISGSPYSRSFSKDSVQLTDINGDGYMDYVTSNSEGEMTVRYNKSGKTNLLRMVTNFTGSSFEMDYDMPLACYDKPQRSWNLSRVETRNNVDSCPVGGNRTLTTFAYESPNYNRHERMDYGYQRVTTFQYDTEGGDSLYRYTVEEFNNRDFTRRGRKTRDCVYDANNMPYVEHIYGDTIYDFAGSVVTDGGCTRTDVYVGVESDLTNWYERQHTAQITSRVVRRYDRYRNVIEYIHYGDTTRNEEWFKAKIDYATGKQHNLVSLPVQIVVTNLSGDTMQKRTATYDSTGKLENLVQYNSAGNAQYEFTYDTCGNMSSVLMPRNKTGQQLRFSYQYDNVVHTYPVRVDNDSLGFFSTAEYNLRFGKPTKTTDINGNEMQYEYDNLGRTVKIIAPYEQDNNAPYTIKMEYHPYNYNDDGTGNSLTPYSYACTYHYDCQHQDNPIKTTLITDGLGRLLQTKKDAEINGREWSLVTGRVKYDCFGRTVEQYHPFEESTTLFAAYNPYYVPTTRTATWYDIMDRQTKVKLPTTDSTVISYGVEAWGENILLRTATKDAMGNEVRVLTGTLGQQLVQIAPDSTITNFEYDCLGRLTKSIDPDGYATQYWYDWFGQLTHRQHPDAGDDYYEYDDAGNMTCHVNDLGDSIKYRYYYNQLTDVEYPRYPANNVHYQYGTAADAATNAVGKIIFQEDASGFQTFKYGKLGEVTENIRTFALPFESQTYTFKMQYRYDSWNRIDSMFYPDGEVVTYSYNLGGMLKRVSGSRPNRPCRYIDSICYNEFELKSEVFYGNGTHTQYAYDDLQRLQTLQSQTRARDAMQDITYTYDKVSNITGIDNFADLPGINFGGTYSHSYVYDSLYRLTYATGFWEDRPEHLRLVDTVQMSYHKNGRIIRKKVFAHTLSPLQMGVINYNRQYNYNTQQPNTLASMFDSISHTTHRFTWQSTGNLLTHTIPERRNMMEHSWTEDNRLQTVTDNNWFSYYQYDASGERTYKLPCGRTAGNRSGERSVYWYPADATLYVSPYLVITPQGYTKHYYSESERVASQIGDGNFANITAFVTDTATANRKLHSANNMVRNLNPNITGATAQFAYLVNSIHSPNIINETYWYHPDHLGSSSWITYSDGSAVQHLHYLPWGEDFVDQRQNFFDGVRYTFSAKERDSETGLSYFGSRYYSSDLSIWLSVDPMSDKYPSLSPYTYCANNPVRLVDPNGEEVVILLGEFMKESDRQNALNDLRNAAPNLKLELKGNNLIVGDGGAAKTKYEKQLANAISSTEVKSVITLELTEATGSYYGTDLIDGQYVSNNSVNPYKTNELEKNTGSVRGCGLMHEITEGYEMGKIAKRENLTHIEKAWRIQGQETIGNGMTIPKDETGSQRHLYEEGHQLATPQPGDWRAKPKRFFNEH